MPRRPAASLVVVQASAWLFLAYAASGDPPSAGTLQLQFRILISYELRSTP